MSLLLNRHTHIALDFEFNRGVVGLSVEQWCVAILLAVEVVFQREDIVWGVLVHWGVRRRTNHDSRIAGVADDDYGHHHGDGVEPTSWDDVFLQEENHQHGNHQDNTNHCTLLDKWYARERHRQHKGDDGAGIDGLFGFNHLVALPYSPHERRSHQYEIDRQTRIERTA